MSIHFPSTAVVDGNESEPPSSPKPTPDSRNNRGLILGVCLGVFSWYVSAVSNIAVHFYWFLPVIAAGNVYFTCTMSYCVYYCSMDLHYSVQISTHTSFYLIFLYSLSLLLCLYSSLSLPPPLLSPPLQVSLVLMFCSIHLGSYSLWLCFPLA